MHICEDEEVFEFDISEWLVTIKSYENLKEIDEKISELKNKKEQAVREKDYLDHVVRELENADVKADEENILVAKKDRLIAKEKIINFLNDVKTNLLESNSQLLLAQKTLIRNQNVINNLIRRIVYSHPKLISTNAIESK